MKKIFVMADDDRDNAELCCEALAGIDRSIICHCVTDGKQVLKRLANKEFQRPQIIFLDINMPGMNGWECLKELKTDEQYRNIPVIMCSTSSHNREANIAIGMGALGFFAKPRDFLELKEILKAIASSLNEDPLKAVSHFAAFKSNK
ncbi:MAG TPA: response regulator [Chryseosolibacter sp.]